MKMKKNRLLSLLLVFALLALPAASMAKEQIDLTDASPQLLAGIAEALHLNTPDLSLIEKELAIQLETGAANGIVKEVPSSPLFRSKDALLVDFTAGGKFPGAAVVDLNLGKDTSGNSGYVRFKGDHGADYIFVPKDTKSKEVMEFLEGTLDNSNAMFPHRVNDVMLGEDLTAFAGALRDANVRFAIAQGRMEGAGPFSPESASMPVECPDGCA